MEILVEIPTMTHLGKQDKLQFEYLIRKQHIKNSSTLYAEISRCHTKISQRLYKCFCS